jgi:hypothetical protein
VLSLESHSFRSFLTSALSLLSPGICSSFPIFRYEFSKVVASDFGQMAWNCSCAENLGIVVDLNQNLAASIKFELQEAVKDSFQAFGFQAFGIRRAGTRSDPLSRKLNYLRFISALILLV